MSHPRAFVIGVLGVLLTGVAIAAGFGFAHDRQALQRSRADAGRVAAQIIRAQVSTTVQRTQDLASLFTASESVTPAEFSRYTDPMLMPTGAAAFGFARRVDTQGRAALERQMGRPIVDLGPDRALVEADRRETYLVITQIKTADRGRSVRGLDLAGDPLRGPTVARALRTGRPQATKPLPFASTGDTGVIFYVPARDDRGKVIGAAFGSFPVATLMERIRAQLPEGTAFSIVEDGAGFGQVGTPRNAVRVDLSTAGRNWRVTVSAPPAPRLGWGSLALIVGGLVLALVAVALLSLLTQTRRVARIVELRSAERDHAERLHRASQERFATAFANAPVGMAIHGADGRILSCNEAYASLAGLREAELIGEHPERFIHPADLAESLVAAAQLRLGTLESAHLEQRFTRADGSQRWVAVHLTVLGGQRETMLAHLVDITERRARERERDSLLEEERRQAERLRELDALRDEFVALATHELRSPLSTITGYVDLLLEDRDRMPADHATFLDTIARTSGQLLDLAANLLDLTRLQDPSHRLELLPLSLSGIAREVTLALKPQADAKGIVVCCDIPAGVPVVGDAVTLRQAVTNLVSNALKYTLDGGSVSVVVTTDETTAHITVRDDGIGIPAAERHRLFERFFRASTATDRLILGSGLGLAITRGIAEAHHGSLEVAHHEPGTSFSLSIPALPRLGAPAQLGPWTGPTRGGSQAGSD